MSAVEWVEQAPVLEVVIPVFNEEAALAPAVERLTRHLAALPWSWQVTIADNASVDSTPMVARRLAHEYDGVRVVRLDEKGRGRALKKVWADSSADVVAYMDVDLSTDLNAVLPLVAPLISGHSDVAIGSRLSRGARVSRGPRREFVSRSYNVILRSTLRAGFRDAQCGFKALRRDVADVLLPLVEDDTWFFDTELLVLAERSGLRIHEVPVDWIDDPDSRVDIWRTALDDLCGIRRLGWALATKRVPLEAVRAQLGTARQQGQPGTQVALFAAVGVVSTLVYALLYLLLRQLMPGLWANALALLITAMANTAANRRLTFGVRGGGHLRHHAQGLIVFAVGLALTSLALWSLDEAAPGAPHVVEVVVLTAVNLAVTVMRFLAMRHWIFRARRPGRFTGPPVVLPDRHETSCRSARNVRGVRGSLPSDGADVR